MSLSETTNDYINSIKCLNKKVYSLVSYLKESDPSAIIVLQSDHGPTPSFVTYDEDSSIYLQEDNWVRILNAIKSPSICETWLQDDLRPINTMRYVLGCISQSKPIYIDEKTYLGAYTDERDYGFVKEHKFNK